RFDIVALVIGREDDERPGQGSIDHGYVAQHRLQFGRTLPRASSPHGYMDAMPTAVRCGTLIDGTGADPVRGATLVFEGNTITSIDRGGQVPRDAEVVDAGHLTVMPGLIDCHVHLSSSTWGVQERLLMPYSLLIAHALNHARISLEAGFTSVRD